MGSVRGFRCQRCRGEVLATEPGRPAWTPPVLCCGAPLSPLAPEQILVGRLVGIRGRLARCPRCGYQVRLVVHPAGPLLCMSCQQAFELGAREAGAWGTGAGSSGEGAPPAPEASGVPQASP